MMITIQHEIHVLTSQKSDAQSLKTVIFNHFGPKMGHYGPGHT